MNYPNADPLIAEIAEIAEKWPNLILLKRREMFLVRGK